MHYEIFWSKVSTSGGQLSNSIAKNKNKNTHMYGDRDETNAIVNGAWLLKLSGDNTLERGGEGHPVVI